MHKMSERIHNKRNEMGWTMEELAEKLGVNKSSVSKWENSQVDNIKRTYIAKMAELFHVKPSWLMGYDSESDITLTYEQPGSETVKLQVDHTPVIGNTSKITELYAALLAIKPENYDIALKILKSLT